MLKYILLVVFLVIWLYLLHILEEAKLYAWKYIVGAAGLFVFMMVYLRPPLTDPLARLVAGIAGIFGNLTGFFEAYFKYGVIFVDSAEGSISLQIDFECSGILEIMAFVSLLSFFRAYSVFERIIVNIIGVIYILLSNVIRIITICCIIHFAGTDYYYMAHTFVGRIVFYALTVFLYFVVFTKEQVIRQKVGGFHYGDS